MGYSKARDDFYSLWNEGEYGVLRGLDVVVVELGLRDGNPAPVDLVTAATIDKVVESSIDLDGAVVIPRWVTYGREEPVERSVLLPSIPHFGLHN